ncbi:uncharacterized protein LOC105168837 isoform X1 [Sesamum indicum]|uniref:Uncharacterized protein LOC105168837 isoform X1 n=1 Tax=Sesamum indicum TaxID=4182 RepID=A0A8M8V4S9_SESIN|nr:uncharacterized protein LOC105168837 isoform X1 [Sesamum indicum]XP_020551328.1 uncharacterized protein LOC105168837 isoform X1 [Sesamum indicum]XP_020551329.1 uncharacterized protein LOC105168837 isoform X1 [Sesamum indicum]XP_020551330.1 uncharacterized protein LOC105168837 isoform X1 [Sesamum indicum]
MLAWVRNLFACIGLSGVFVLCQFFPFVGFSFLFVFHSIINNLHLRYCMKILLEEHCDDWLCEDCESVSKPRSAASTLSRELPSLSKLANSVEVNDGAILHARAKKWLNESRKVSSDWEKKVATGKTKYILAEEAIKLSSGAMKSLSNLKVSQRSSLLQPKGGNRSRRSSIRPLTEHISFSQQDLYKRASLKLKTQRLGNTEICQLQKQQSKKLTGGNGCTPVQLRSDFERHSWTPALSTSWKGSFCIHDDLKHAELNLQIEGHSPSQVRRKVYRFSKQMPEVLHFELVSCKIFWKIFFQEYLPDGRDIGLYFFSSDRERSDDYISLLETISVENLALRKQFDDVELLVFTSKLLPVDCQRWEGKYFLWGVFHRLKQDSTACLGNRGAKFSLMPSLNANYGCNQGDDHQEVHMDMDLLSGVNVGKMEVPVRHETLREEHMNFRNDSGGGMDFWLKQHRCCDQSSSAKCQKRSLL